MAREGVSEELLTVDGNCGREEESLYSGGVDSGRLPVL